MAEPPASPPSSDIGGADRDEQKIVTTRKATTEAPQDKTFLGARADDAARPPYDPDIATKGNSR